MSLRKRLRVLWAGLTQEWHLKICAECSAPWWAVGKDRGLIAICDACESENLDRMAVELEREYRKRALSKGAW